MALAQAARVAEALTTLRPDLPVETVVISTHGDRWMGSLSGEQAGGKGAFVREIDRALLAGEIDLAVHCLKDIPGDVPTPAGLCFAAHLEREDVHDCVVTRPDARWKLADAPAGTRVGTSSVRRAAQLARHLPQLVTTPMRGNVNTRLSKLDEHRDGIDILVLAVAGLERVGQTHRIAQVLDLDVMAPPVGAGVIVVQTRADDGPTRQLVAALDDASTAAAATAERAMLAELRGHCNSPITGYATVEADQLTLRGGVYAPDGAQWLEAAAAGPVDQAERLGVEAAAQLLALGARELIDAIPH
jgi:hydroxymethylbilane synthase